MAAPHRQWLVERLKQLGIGRADLARKAGVSRRQVERWFAGGGAHMSTQYDLALALDLPPQHVFALFASKEGKVKTLSVQGEQDRDGDFRPVSDESFYSYYSSKIATARGEVWVTSDGFNMSNEVSRRYANIMEPGFKAALANGAQVHRFQILETMHINWIDELLRLKAEYPRLFRIFVDKGAANVPSVCSIDAKSQDCVAEAFEGTRGGFCQGTVATDYSFRLHDQTKARQSQDIVESAIDAASADELSLKGLKHLRKQLFSERVEQLRKWYEEHDDANIANSGVFDEVVISHFVRQAVTKAK